MPQATMSAQHPEEWYVGDGEHYTIWTKGKKGWTKRFSRRTIAGMRKALLALPPFVPLNKTCVLDRRGQLYVGWEDPV